jgi:tRNA (adenine57-N1/adenine58-N1)-methyltransferase
MVEIAHKRLEVRRERVGIENGLTKGVVATAANVEEAVSRLKEIEGRFKSFHAQNGNRGEEDLEMEDMGEDDDRNDEKRLEKGSDNPNSKERILESLVDRKIYKEGRLIHRSEQEIKLHTSYLLFAVLPQEWTAEDEEKARATWPVKRRDSGGGPSGNAGAVFGMTRKQMKRAAKQAQKDKSDKTRGDDPKKRPQVDEPTEQNDNGIDEAMNEAVTVE